MAIAVTVIVVVDVVKPDRLCFLVVNNVSIVSRSSDVNALDSSCRAIEVAAP